MPAFAKWNIIRSNPIDLQLTAGGSANPFFVDDIQLMAKPGPALVHLSINATQSVRRVDARWFGVNRAVWDRYLDTAETVSLLREMGTRALRFPRGSLSDEYHWESNTTGTNSWKWATSFDWFSHTATNIDAQASPAWRMNCNPRRI